MHFFSCVVVLAEATEGGKSFVGKEGGADKEGRRRQWHSRHPEGQSFVSLVPF